MPLTEPTIATDRTVPRVLLFGYPASGKSWLVGALLQASERQGEALGFEVVDPPRQLELLRDHIYHDTDFENTRTELVRLAVRLRPASTNRDPGAVPAAVELLDCDGFAAKGLLKHPDAITEPQARGTVVSAIVQADAILLVVNAGASDDELNATFDDFFMFLERVHGRKAYGREVGGFPVFIVLSQCDRLARRGDTQDEWEARVRGNRKYVLTRFAEFLEDHRPPSDDGSPYLPFGGIEVEGYTVAIRRPEFLNDPDPPNEPYGIAELFRDAFAAAKAYSTRTRSSGRRLAATLWAVVATVGVLLAGSVVVTVYQPPPADPGLADRVRVYELQEAPAAVRLADKNIARSKRALTAFRSDPGFFALPEDLQTFVEGRLQEIDAYQAYSEKLEKTPAPAEARTLEELDRVRTLLTDDLALPAEYTWGETEAALLRDKWLADVPLIRTAESGWYEWYRGLINQATELTLTKSFESDWRGRIDALDTAADRQPFAPSDPIPGSEAVPQPRGEAVTFRVPFEFDRVYQARRDWEFTRTRLLHLRDLADALGLTPPEAGELGRRALVLPPPGPTVDVVALPLDRLTALQRYFPRPSPLYLELQEPVLGATRASVAYPEWELANFPEPARTLLANRARESFANGVLCARRLVLGRLGSPPEGWDFPDAWLKVAGSLDDPPFRDWGRLLRLLAQLENPLAVDPVSELTDFLERRSFEIHLKGLELSIPLALRVPPAVPTGPVTITVTPRGGGAPIVRTYRQTGEGTQRGLVVVHRFGPDASFTYRPGDSLRVEVPVRSGDQRFSFVWDEGGTKTFQFDRLSREPKLVQGGALPTVAPGVLLTPGAGSLVPRIPILLPDTRR